MVNYQLLEIADSLLELRQSLTMARSDSQIVVGNLKLLNARLPSAWSGPHPEQTRAFASVLLEAYSKSPDAWFNVISAINKLESDARQIYGDWKKKGSFSNGSTDEFTEIWRSECVAFLRRIETPIVLLLRAKTFSPEPAGSHQAKRKPWWNDGNILASDLIGMSPKDVTFWWNHLDPKSKRFQIDFFPDVVGNLDGVPITARVDANYNQMNALLQMETDPEGPVHRRFRKLGLMSESVPATLMRYRHIVLFDNSDDGQIAEVWGSLTAAEYTIFVPGMGSTMNNFLGTSVRADRLSQKSGVATIAWLGYDPPSDSDSVEVLRKNRAEMGGRNLRRFAEGLQSNGASEINLVGHSYGSTTVGAALLDGLKVDRVVFVGSPGVGVNNVGEFPDGAANKYYASGISGDLVARAGRFGIPPTDRSFDAVVYSSGSAPILRAHGEYFDGKGLENLSRVLTDQTPHDSSLTEKAESIAWVATTTPITATIEFVSETTEVASEVISKTTEGFKWISKRIPRWP